MTTNNNSTIDESKIGKPYHGPTKLVWNENGQQVRVPDTDALANPFVPRPVTNDNNDNNTAVVKEFKYEKTLDQVLSSTDRFQ